MSTDFHGEVHADWPNRIASRNVHAGGIQWHVQQLGEQGPHLLLLHGSGAATHSWGDLAPLLATRFRVVAPDLPGHGYTDRGGEGDLSLAGMAAGVAALLEVLDVHPDLVVGHSAGAAVLARMCLDGAIDPAALISLNGALLPFGGMMGKVFPYTARVLAAMPVLPQLIAFRARRRPIIDRLIAQTGSPPESVDLSYYQQLSQSPKHISGVLGMMANWDLDTLERDILQLSTPLHLVACANDKAVPAAQARYLKTRINSAHLHIIPQLGHLGHEEDPQQFAELIRGIARDSGVQVDD